LGGCRRKPNYLLVAPCSFSLILRSLPGYGDRTVQPWGFPGDPAAPPHHCLPPTAICLSFSGLGALAWGGRFCDREPKDVLGFCA